MHLTEQNVWYNQHKVNTHIQQSIEYISINLGCVKRHSIAEHKGRDKILVTDYNVIDTAKVQ